MALDDFTTAENEQEVVGDAGTPLAEEASSKAGDVDLFDFPVVRFAGESVHVEDVPAPFPDDVASEQASEASGDESSLFAVTDEELDMVRLAAQPPVEEAPVEEAPVEEAPVDETPVEEAPVDEIPVEDPTDPSLDEDIFDFGELFESVADSASAEEHITKNELFDDPEPVEAIAPVEPVSEVGPDASSSSVDLAELNDFVPEPLVDEPVAQSESHPAPATKPIASHKPAARETVPSETVRQAPRTVGVSPVAENPHAPVPISAAQVQNLIRTPLVLAIAATILVLNATMIFFAWQASRSITSAVDGVRTDIARSIQNPTPIYIQPPTGPLVHQETPIVESTPRNSGTEKFVDSHLQPPAPLEAYEVLELSLARTEISEHRFGDARKRINRLLANSDRMGLPNQIIADAKYLIAESYLLQARVIEEDNR